MQSEDEDEKLREGNEWRNRRVGKMIRREKEEE